MGSRGSVVPNLHVRNIPAKLPVSPLRAMRLLHPCAACGGDRGSLDGNQEEGKRDEHTPR